MRLPAQGYAIFSMLAGVFALPLPPAPPLAPGRHPVYQEP